ncbi:MAG TPA: hypothetical protein VD794_16365 [Flavisolibacter sp.]|nr:hypothetical protein [Flavisolibacter sp.]
MQTVSNSFTELATGHVRPISHALNISFQKNFDSDINFFTLDQSVLNGADILASAETDVISEWDKYDYAPYADRVTSIEWQREKLFPSSVCQAIADITLNNFDNYFTKNSGSPIDEYLLPQRPLKILSGFGGNNIPQFVGLTDSVPVVDTDNRTVSLHCTDFLSFIFNKPLDQTVVYEDLYTHEVLSALFDEVGLLPEQYELEGSLNQIHFVYFEKGTKLGDAIQKLMEAEAGTLYMDERGIIRFTNRLSFSNTPIYSFDESSIIDYKSADETKIINVVEIKSSVRIVQGMQPVYTIVQPLEINGGAPELFVSFDDPVTSLATITAFEVNTAEDGSGTNITGNVTVSSVELFNTAAKITFSNTAGGTAYITSLTIFGTPAKVARNIYLRDQNDDSVAKYEEQVLTIENDFIQTNSAAQSLALSILNLYKDYAAEVEIEVKGTPALQIDDVIEVTYKGITETYNITKIQNLRNDAQFKQILTARQTNGYSFFTLNQSILNSIDVLAP